MTQLPSIKTAGIWGGLTVWAGLVSAVSASFLASHLLTLPMPDTADARLNAAVVDTRIDATKWTMLHALSSECRCSGLILDHLTATERPPGTDETTATPGATKSGFEYGSGRSFSLMKLLR